MQTDPSAPLYFIGAMATFLVFSFGCRMVLEWKAPSRRIYRSVVEMIDSTDATVGSSCLLGALASGLGGSIAVSATVAFFTAIFIVGYHGSARLLTRL